MERSNDEETVDEVFIAQPKEEEIKAKLTKQEQCKSRQVQKEVEDTDQECILLCWGVKSKIISNKPGKKARLCAYDFEGEQSYCTGSSTCSREGIQIMFTLYASKK